jgi:hypothetical protein
LDVASLNLLALVYVPCPLHCPFCAP